MSGGSGTVVTCHLPCCLTVPGYGAVSPVCRPAQVRVGLVVNRNHSLPPPALNTSRPGWHGIRLDIVSVGSPRNASTVPVANFDAFGQNESDFSATIFDALHVGKWPLTACDLM